MARVKASYHPINIFLDWVKQHRDAVFEFSEYVYVPTSVVDERSVFTLPARDLSISWLDQKLSVLAAGRELALHSRVYQGQDVLQIPMIDFVNFTPATHRILESILPRHVLESLFFCDSGRSFHGYSLELLGQDAWIKFMGSLLLCNLPDGPPTVDQRWIGHRLIAGYGALRWSCNTGAYLQYPEVIASVDMYMQR